MSEYIREPYAVTVRTAPAGVIVTMVAGLGASDYAFLLTPRQVAQLRRDLAVEIEGTLSALKDALDDTPTDAPKTP